MLATAIAALRRAPSLRPHALPLAALVLGYLGNLLPFSAIARPMYLYHYFPALLFGVLCATLGVGALLGWDREPARLFDAPWPSPRSRAAWGAIIGAVVLLFVYLSPMNYGRPLTPEGVQHRKWILERH